MEGYTKLCFLRHLGFEGGLFSDRWLNFVIAVIYRTLVLRRRIIERVIIRRDL